MSRITFYDDILPYIHADLPGCPRPVVIQELREAINDFLRKTHVWKVDLDPIYRRAGTTDYDLDGIPDNAQIQLVTAVTNDGRLLTPVKDYTCPRRELLRLATAPTESKSRALEVSVALRLTNEAESMDDEAFDAVWRDWRQAIRHGVLARLKAQPDKTWSNPEQANFNSAKEYELRAECLRQLRRDTTTGRIKMTAPHRFTLR